MDNRQGIKVLDTPGKIYIYNSYKGPILLPLPLILMNKTLEGSFYLFIYLIIILF